MRLFRRPLIFEVLPSSVGLLLLANRWGKYLAQLAERLRPPGH